MNAYIDYTGVDFDPKTDFVSIGFREVDSNQIIAGTNTWSFNPSASNMTGEGIFVVEDPLNDYEFVNLQRKSTYLNGGDITETISQSYFASQIVTVIISKISPG